MYIFKHGYNILFSPFVYRHLGAIYGKGFLNFPLPCTLCALPNNLKLHVRMSENTQITKSLENSKLWTLRNIKQSLYRRVSNCLNFLIIFIGLHYVHTCISHVCDIDLMTHVVCSSLGRRHSLSYYPIQIILKRIQRDDNTITNCTHVSYCTYLSSPYSSHPLVHHVLSNISRRQSVLPWLPNEEPVRQK